MTEIPEAVREALSDSYTERGVQQAWGARWMLLDGQRLCDVWERDPERCLAVIESLNRGDYV
jgi:hypothetical protein